MILRRIYARNAAVIVLLISFLCVFVSAEELLVGGQTVGMKVKLDGLLITSIESGSPAERAGLRSGDTLMTVGDVPLESVDQLTQRVQNGGVLVLGVFRNGEMRTLFVQPVKSGDAFRLGAAVRDDLAGIGTVTYYRPETGSFGALGHGICDYGGTSLLRINGGVIVPSSIVNVEKSTSGTAGQLQGQFDTERRIGTIDTNTMFGVFGTTEGTGYEKVETASADQIQTGAALIRANVEGADVREFEVEIVSKLPEAMNTGKDFLIRVTDPELLAITGGIVQGMSGSPILQNGKLIGAVTHVLINSPEYGYAISIDRMLETERGRQTRPLSVNFIIIRQISHWFVEFCRQKLAENSIIWIEIEVKM